MITIVPDTVPAVQTQTAAAAYRAHLFGDCQPCAGGHWCSVLDRLDWLAAREASRTAIAKATGEQP